MSYVEDMVKIGVFTQEFADAKQRLVTVYYSALDTVEDIGFGRFYVMRRQIDDIREKAENELLETFPPGPGAP